MRVYLAISTYTDQTDIQLCIKLTRAKNTTEPVWNSTSILYQLLAAFRYFDVIAPGLGVKYDTNGFSGRAL